MTDINKKITDLNKKILEVDKLIKEGKDVIRVLQTSSRKIDNKSDFTGSDLLRGNKVGNFIRGSKHKSVNKSIDRAQEVILDFENKLLLFDRSLADILILPKKMTEYNNTNSKLEDIALRTSMRKRELDINKAKRSVEKVVRKLITLRKRLDYDIKKHKEYKEL